MLRRCSTTSSSGPVRRDASRRQTERRRGDRCPPARGRPARPQARDPYPSRVLKLYGSGVDWAYRTVPQEHLDGREIYVPLGKTLGGSSSINAQMVLRGHAADQEAWQAPGWGWPEAEQAYARSSSAFLREPLRDPAAHPRLRRGRALGIPPSADLNAPDNSGVGLVPVSQRRGRRWSVADGYLRPALRRPVSPRSSTGARAARILLDRGRAAGCVPAGRPRGGGTRAARGDRELRDDQLAWPAAPLRDRATEAIEGVGLELVHELPGVGRNLRDHLANGIFCRTHDW